MALLREPDRQKVFSRRVAMLAGGKALLLSALAGRMYFLQVVESDRYATLAEENRINLRLLPPPRGRILDRNGRPLAVNRQNYRVVVVREQSPDFEGTLDSLSRIIPISEAERQRIAREIQRKRSFVPITVHEDLSWEEVARIEVNAPDLPGVHIEVGQVRHYVYGADLAHVLGYVAAVSEGEMTGDPLLELPGFRIGKAGVEKIHDLALRGASGSSQVEVNALGRVIRELNRHEGQPGSDLALTLDLNLQQLASQRLVGQSGAVAVIDVHTGAVLALASTPGYDPNAFNRGLTVDEWQTLIGNPKAPLTNKAVAGQYAPGSTFKPVVALAAMERGVATPDTRVTCWGRTRLGNALFHCWKRGGHGSMDMRQALAQSCDVYFYELAKRTGIDRIAALASRLGLGDVLELDLPGERPGLLPTRDWKLATIGTPWQMGETLIAGIGQGYILTTPLQLAVMTARLVNGGRAVTPYLTRPPADAPDTGTRPTPADLGLDPTHLKIVLDGMNEVVNGRRGTARGSKIKEENLKMAGKTGTAQVRRITKAEREIGVIKNEDLPWERRDHALFIGYAPVHAPRFACAVVVEHGGGGSKVAAPIAREVLLEAQKLYAPQVAATDEQDRDG